MRRNDGSWRNSPSERGPPRKEASRSYWSGAARADAPGDHDGHERDSLNERNMIMLYKSKTLSGHTCTGLDGEIGKVREFYFDDQHWAIRYLVADTEEWLAGRQVLISPMRWAPVNEDEETDCNRFDQKTDRGQSVLEYRQPRLASIRGVILRVLWMAGVLDRPLHVGGISLHCSSPGKNKGDQSVVEKHGMHTCAVRPP